MGYGKPTITVHSHIVNILIHVHLGKHDGAIDLHLRQVTPPPPWYLKIIV